MSFSVRWRFVVAVLNLVVIKSARPEQLLAFYRLLGLAFDQEQHGQGPVHWAAESNGAVFEIYPHEGEFSGCETVRLGFAVPTLNDVMDAIQENRHVVSSAPKQTPWGLRAVVRDPDGRAVEVIENGSTAP